MKLLVRYLRSISIKKRLLIGFILVPVLVMSVFFCAYDVISRSMILEKSTQNSEQLLTIITENFNLNINKFEQQLDEIMSYDAIHSCIDEADSTDYNRKRELYSGLNDYINSKTHFLSNAYELSVYTLDLTLTYSKGAHTFQEEIVKEIAPQAEQALGQSVWFYGTIGNDGVVALARALYDQTSGQCKGYVFLAINESAFTSLFASDDQMDQGIIVVDNEYNYLFGQYDLKSDTPLFEDGAKELKYQTQNYYIHTKEIQDVPWLVVHMVSESYALKELNSLRSTVFLYILLIFFVLLFIMTVIYRSFYDPLKHILTSMEELSDERLDERINDIGNDELHELSENYNDLVMRIQNLVLRVEEEESAKRDAEIKMLQAQINPHFLFNTLNTLRYLAILNNDKPLSQGINALAKLLRNTITDSKELVEIQDELENVQNYIIIQKLRYGDLFETEIHIDEELKHAKIMKFLLQPIVENAILHGFEEDREDQLLSIRIIKTEEHVLVEIKDNGKGFDLHSQAGKTKSRLSGIGMSNIEDRIQLTYGEKYRMHTVSVLGKGTTVRLYLPYIA